MNSHGLRQQLIQTSITRIGAQTSMAKGKLRCSKRVIFVVRSQEISRSQPVMAAHKSGPITRRMIKVLAMTAVIPFHLITTLQAFCQGSRRQPA